MKQSQSFKVGIYLQIQLHHQRIRAQCCSWGKTAWTGHTLSWQAEPPFFLTRSPCNWKKLFPPECWWLQRRGIFLASLQNLGNCGLLGLHLPSSRAGYILYLQANNHKLQILSFSIISLLSSASSSSSSSIILSESDNINIKSELTEDHILLAHLLHFFTTVTFNTLNI